MASVRPKISEAKIEPTAVPPATTCAAFAT